jgi:hypothetical protein
MIAGTSKAMEQAFVSKKECMLESLNNFANSSSWDAFEAPLKTLKAPSELFVGEAAGFSEEAADFDGEDFSAGRAAFGEKEAGFPFGEAISETGRFLVRSPPAMAAGPSAQRKTKLIRTGNEPANAGRLKSRSFMSTQHSL